MILTKKAAKEAYLPRNRQLIGLELKRGDSTVIRWISENKPNGPLTSVGCVELLKKLTGFNQDEILEEVREKVMH